MLNHYYRDRLRKTLEELAKAYLPITDEQMEWQRSADYFGLYQIKDPPHDADAIMIDGVYLRDDPAQFAFYLETNEPPQMTSACLFLDLYFNSVRKAYFTTGIDVGFLFLTPVIIVVLYQLRTLQIETWLVTVIVVSSIFITCLGLFEWYQRCMNLLDLQTKIRLIKNGLMGMITLETTPDNVIKGPFTIAYPPRQASTLPTTEMPDLHFRCRWNGTPPESFR